MYIHLLLKIQIIQVVGSVNNILQTLNRKSTLSFKGGMFLSDAYATFLINVFAKYFVKAFRTTRL